MGEYNLYNLNQRVEWKSTQKQIEIYKIQKYKIQNTKYKIQNTKYKNISIYKDQILIFSPRQKYTVEELLGLLVLQHK